MIPRLFGELRMHMESGPFYRMILVAVGFWLMAASATAVTCLNGIPASNPDSAYTVHGDGTVTDMRTGLMWKVCAEGQTWNAGVCTWSEGAYSWDAALALAEVSTYAGHADWRLPNFRELRSLVEVCRVSPAINDTVFPGASSSVFWSGSPRTGFSDYARYVSFDVGGATGYDGSRSNGYSVRLVRGGQ